MYLHIFHILSRNLWMTRNLKDTDVRFAVRQKYPVEQARQPEPLPSYDKVVELLEKAKVGENLRKILTPHFQFGPALLEHCFRTKNLPSNGQVMRNIFPENFPDVYSALEMADEVFTKSRHTPSKGILIVKKELKTNSESEILETYQEYHPMLFVQHEDSAIKGDSIEIKEFEAFTMAVDEFYSKKESQKMDLKALQQEREALKKLENIKKDHQNRLQTLQNVQETDRRRASLIEMNQELVDRAILVIRSALANQHSWETIKELVEDAKDRDDPVASAIKQLKLDVNHVTLELRNPYHSKPPIDDGDSEDSQGKPFRYCVIKFAKFGELDQI